VYRSKLAAKATHHRPARHASARPRGRSYRPVRYRSLRVPGPCPLAYAVADCDADPNANDHTNANSYTYRHADRDRNANADRDRHANVDRDRHANVDRDRHTNVDGNRHSHPDTCADAKCIAHTNSDSHSRTDPNAKANPDRDQKTNADADQEANANQKTDANGYEKANANRQKTDVNPHQIRQPTTDPDGRSDAWHRRPGDEHIGIQRWGARCHRRGRHVYRSKQSSNRGKHRLGKCQREPSGAVQCDDSQRWRAVRFCYPALCYYHIHFRSTHFGASGWFGDLFTKRHNCGQSRDAQRRDQVRRPDTNRPPADRRQDLAADRRFVDAWRGAAGPSGQYAAACDCSCRAGNRFGGGCGRMRR
jgi:hypothetical protein